MSHRLIKYTIVCVIITLTIVIFSYNFLDIKVAKAVHDSNLLDGKTTRLAVTLISKIFSPKVWIAITAVVATICYISKYLAKKTTDKLSVISLSLVVAITITVMLKFLLGRYRPEVFFFDNRYGFNFLSFKKSYNSMPSGHTTLTFTGLLAIANFFEKKSITMIAVAVSCLVAVSRIITLNHYVSDIIISIYIGIFAYFWSRAFLELRIRNL